jgi:hypothetical protein
MGEERRNIKTLAAIVQRVIQGVVQNPSVTLTVLTLQQWLGVPMEAAERILNRLASSGLVREVQRGVWDTRRHWALDLLGTGSRRAPPSAPAGHDLRNVNVR